MRLTLLALLFFCSLALHAQKPTGKIIGTISSDSTRQVVAGATVSLVNSADSSVERIIASDKKGTFSFNEVKNGNYNILITAINHRPFLKFVTISETKKEVILDTLLLQFTADSLAAVTVVGYKLPVVLKMDTTEFDASSFKTRENAMVEDLLKKLPGIEIGKDGTVKAEGEKVTQILVDGKPFFGTDPKMATQNLPSNIIDKVQIIDRKSEQAQVTKVEDGIREKVINITIKKDKNKGYFGRAYAGYGTNERYEARLSGNYFKGIRKISFVSGGNNTGRSDYTTGNNEEQSNYNNSNGITRDVQSKITYVDKWGKKFDVNANIGYSNNTTVSEQTRNRQNIFGDSSNFYFEQSKSVRDRSGVNGSFGFEYKPDTLISIRFNQGINFSRNEFSTGAKFNSRLASNKRLNEGSRRNFNVTTSPSFNGNISINKRFKNSRRGVFFNLNNNINNNIGDGFNISNNYFFPVNSADYSRLLNQFANNDNRSTSINSSVSYSEPVTKKSTLNVSLSYNYSKNNSLREIFNFNTTSHLYDLLNDTLSNNFNNFNHNTSTGLNYSYSFKKGSIAIGGTWQNARTKSESLTNDSIYLQSFSGLVPYLSFNRSNKGKRVNVNYSFSNRAPQAYQLQPVVDNTNPLYLRLGNPNLKYSTIHRVNYNYSFYNAKKQSSFNASGGISATYNSISNSSIFNKSNGSQITQPINVNGVYNANGYVNYSKPFKLKKQKLFWNNSFNYNLGRNVSLIDNLENINRSTGGRLSTGLRIEVEDVLELSTGYNISYQDSRFSLRQNLNNTSYTYGAETILEFTPGKSTEITVNWDFSKNTGRSAGFNREINMINADVTQFMNKKKSWWLKLKVYDLLKENVSIYRYSGESFIEDNQMNVLTRFFLLSLNVKLSKFSGKPPSSTNVPPTIIRR
jgi:hypothetical protein